MSNNDDDDDEESITITTEENPMDVSFRDPSGNSFAIGLITGGVEMWRRTSNNKKSEETNYDPSAFEIGQSVIVHENGDALVTGSGDCSVMLIDSNTEQAIGRIAEAHEQAITRLAVLDNANVIATGCDEGVVKIWDIREERCVHCSKKTKYL